MTADPTQSCLQDKSRVNSQNAVYSNCSSEYGNAKYNNDIMNQSTSQNFTEAI